MKVTKLIPNERIEFGWETNSGGYDTHVVMTFESLDGGSMLVRVIESGWHEDEKGLEDSYGNCFGWTQMLCCLKAWRSTGSTSCRDSSCRFGTASGFSRACRLRPRPTDYWLS